VREEVPEATRRGLRSGHLENWELVIIAKEMNRARSKTCFAIFNYNAHSPNT
jgi:hypothetical protein